MPLAWSMRDGDFAGVVDEEGSAAGREGAAGGGGQLVHGLVQVLVGVNRGVADADLVVEVGAGAASAGAYVADDLAAVSIGHAGDHHDAVGGGADGLSEGGGDVDAGVEGAFSVERVFALAERAGDGSDDGPEGGRVGKIEPVVAAAAGGAVAVLKGVREASGKSRGAQAG